MTLVKKWLPVAVGVAVFWYVIYRLWKKGTPGADDSADSAEAIVPPTGAPPPYTPMTTSSPAYTVPSTSMGSARTSTAIVPPYGLPPLRPPRVYS